MNDLSENKDARAWLMMHYKGTKMCDWPLLVSDAECEEKRARILRTLDFLNGFPAEPAPAPARP